MEKNGKTSNSLSKAFDLSAFLREIDEASSICVSGHENPDGDALGACFAMGAFIRGRGKEPHILLEPFSERFRYIKGRDMLAEEGFIPEPGGLLICLDCASKERLGPGLQAFDKASVTWNIDHHVSNTLYAGNNYLPDDVSSTSEAVFGIINEAGGLTKDIAVALYTGILTDTGGFRHSCTTAKTHEAAAALHRMGIGFTEIQRKAMYEHSPAEAAIYAAAIGSMKLYPEIGYACASLTQEQMDAAGAKGPDLEGIAEYMLNTRGVRVSALLSRRDTPLTHISLRSLSLDVGKIAETFGGGGHKYAAGGRLEQPLEQVEAALYEAVKKAVAAEDR